MPASPSTGKKGRVTRVTRVNVDHELVRVEREGDEHTVADVVDHRQTRTSVTHRNKGKQVAALPSSDHDTKALGPANDASDSQEAEELLSEAEELLHEPIQRGKRSVTSRHRDGAGPSRFGEDGAGGSLDAVPDTQHQIEEVHPGTVEDEVQAEPHVEEPESSVSGPPERSAPAKSGGIVPRMKGILTSIVHIGQEGPSRDAADKEEATSKVTSPDKTPTRATTRGSKHAEKGKAVASPVSTPAKKGKAAAKRAAEPMSEKDQSPKKTPKPTTETPPPTPAKPPPTPAGSAKKAASAEVSPKATSSKAGRPSQKGSKRKKRSVETYKTYIYKVLKEVHPDVGISKQGMQVMQTFAVDMFDRIMLEAARLCRISNKATLSSREIQTAVRLLMPGELSKHAVTEGTKAVTKATKEPPNMQA